MKQELDLDYDIISDNMIDMIQSQESNGFKLEESTFINNESKRVNKNILARESDYIREQIFQMTDGNFILEVEENMVITYFYSKDIQDLVQ